MTNNMKKFLFFFACFLILTTSSFAVPGFTSYLKDSSGQYVYYRDSSFVRESYIGILTYDESTYQVRYYAPKDEKKKLPEKDVAILMTVNPEANGWEMTGERLMSKITSSQEDVDLINYIHDLLYEFASRRSKLDFSPYDDDYVWSNDFNENGITRTQEYFQFGGNVTINFDCLIPLFNIKSITTADGDVVFRCCTIGCLKSSDDKSFNEFKGIKAPNMGVKADGTDEGSVTVYSAKKTRKHVCGNRSVTLDQNWSSSEESPNICTLGNDSVITMFTIPKLADDKKQNEFYSIFAFLNSVYTKYIDLSSCELNYNKKKKAYTITVDSYIPESNSFITASNILLETPQGGYDVLTLSTYKKPLQENRDYFTKIINTYK